MFFFTVKFLNQKFIINYRILTSRSFTRKQPIENLLSMSKYEYQNNSEKIRQVKAENSYLSPTVQLLVVGSGAPGLPSNVLLINSNIRYLINCGEGTQKLGSEYRMNLEKTTHVLVTHTSWKNVSGFMGLFLMMQQSGKKELSLHGLSLFETVFPTLSKHSKLSNVRLLYESSQHNKEFSDGVTIIKYVHIYPSSMISDKDFEASKFTNEGKEKTQRKSALNKNLCSLQSSENNECNENMNFDKKIDNGSSANNCLKILNACKTFSRPAISYIFQTLPTSGALLFEKCLEYGVPSGPLLRQLKLGNDVTLSNGKIVKSSDVKNPDLPGVNIIAVECPSENYLDSLLKEQAFKEYQFGGKVAEAVIHFSCSQIVKNSKYQEWINNFPKGTKHLFINEDNNMNGSVGIPRQQFKLNYLHKDIFPLLHETNIPDFPRSENTVTEKGHDIVFKENSNLSPIYSDKIFYKCESNFFINGETMCTFYIKPKLNYDYSKCLVLKKDEFLNEMFRNNAREKIEKCKENIKNFEQSLISDNRIYPKIVFLGTGSSRPSKVRNASGILVFLDENKCILCDCGENIYNQLVIFYGKQKTAEILRKIHAIFISHLHLDHQMGLITILTERKLAFDELRKKFLGKKLDDQMPTQEIHQEFKPVFLLAPEQILKWLEAFNAKIEDISSLFDFLPNSLLVENKEEAVHKVELFKKSLNLLQATTVPVLHSPNSFGISIIHKSRRKITYSGDTKPCDALVKSGKNSDILIHEATFDESFVKEARLKLHSTTNQALEIGRKMNAKHIILTHFSQRYCYLPVIEKSFEDSNVGIAFDFMEVAYNKLPLLPKLLEPVQYVFSENNEKYQLERQNTYLKRKINGPESLNFETEASNNDEGSADTGEKRPAKILKKNITHEDFKLFNFDRI